MAVYELKKLNTAIEFIDRLAEGKNPVSNEPASGKEILDEPEMIRCLYLVKGVLRDVLDNKGAVGRQKSEKKSIEDIFPFEVLTAFKYRQDQTISDLINQILELLPEDMDIRIPATRITNWLRSSGYLEKKYMADINKEASYPTEKGEALGILAVKAGFRSNEYYRILYNQNAQQFIVENLEMILHGAAV